MSVAWQTGVYCLVDRYLLLGGQVSIAWQTSIYCLMDRYLLLGGKVSIVWQTGVYCLADASTGFRYPQVTNQINGHGSNQRCDQ